MTKAIWNGVVLAESDQTVVVEGNHYFPSESINRQYFRPSETHTVCSWKGIASYYDLVVDGQVNRNAAWYYPEPKRAANNIKGYIAFWKGVSVESEQEKARPGLFERFCK
jgi:uncharacterized protein (DUF427 family)